MKTGGLFMQEEAYIKKLSKELQKKYKEGNRKVETGRYNEAEGLLREILEVEAEFVPVFNKLGVISIYKKDLDMARKHLNQALTIDSEFAPSLTNMGSIVRESGDMIRAKKYYKKALESDEEYGPAYNNLGVIAREEGDFAESVKYLKKARKYGNYTVNISRDKRFYKEPGCIFSILFLIILLVLLYFWLT